MILLCPTSLGEDFKIETGFHSPRGSAVKSPPHPHLHPRTLGGRCLLLESSFAWTELKLLGFSQSCCIGTPPGFFLSPPPSAHSLAGPGLPSSSHILFSYLQAQLRWYLLEAFPDLLPPTASLIWTSSQSFLLRTSESQFFPAGRMLFCICMPAHSGQVRGCSPSCLCWHP